MSDLSSHTLRIHRLKKFYKKKIILKNFNCCINTGECVGLLGPNGAGKTTSFYCIAGLIAPSEGEIFFDNINITFDPIHRRAQRGIIYLPQENSIFRGMTVEENILSVLEMHVPQAAKRHTLLKKILNDFKITGIQKSLATTLSGGERRRVEIARCIACRPKFILLDEPFAGIDPLAVQDLKGLIHYLKTQNIGLLITDHNAVETLHIVDRAYILYNGEILVEGTPQEIIQNNLAKQYYLGNNFLLNPLRSFP